MAESWWDFDRYVQEELGWQRDDGEDGSGAWMRETDDPEGGTRRVRAGGSDNDGGANDLNDFQDEYAAEQLGDFLQKYPQYAKMMFPNGVPQNLGGSGTKDVGHYNYGGENDWGYMYDEGVAAYAKGHEGLAHLNFNPTEITEADNPYLAGRKYLDSSQSADWEKVTKEYNTWKSQQSHGWTDFLPYIAGAGILAIAPYAATLGVGEGLAGAAAAAGGAGGAAGSSLSGLGDFSLAGGGASGGGITGVGAGTGNLGLSSAAGGLGLGSTTPITALGSGLEFVPGAAAGTGGVAAAGGGWLNDPSLLSSIGESTATFDPFAVGGVPNAAGDVLALTEPVASGGAIATGASTTGAWWEPFYDSAKGIFKDVFAPNPVSGAKTAIDGISAIANYFINQDQQDRFEEAMRLADPFGPQRPFYQGELRNAFTDPNYFANNTLMKGINDEVMTNTIGEMSKRGLGRSGEFAKELAVRQTNATYPFMNNYLQTLGNFAGANIQPTNSANIAVQAANSNANNWNNILGGVGQVLQGTGALSKIGDAIGSILP